MLFDLDNKVIQLCSLGMNYEGEGKPDAAKELFQLAWKKAETDLEKFVAAHYVARHQKNVTDKLGWDIIALDFALKMEDARASYPSLYLNVAKGYEDMQHVGEALKNYELGLSFADFLAEDGYGRMIRTALLDGIARTQK